MKMNRLAKSMVSAAIVLPLVLSGCSSKQGAPAASSGKVTTDPVEINLWGGYPELDPWYNKMIEGYHKDHPNVTIKLTSFPLRDFEKKVATAVPSNSAAEIISINPSLVYRYIQGNLLQKTPDDLSQFVKNERFPKILSDKAMDKGVVYGVPHMMAKGILFYNKKMFQEAGLSGPPKDMDQYIEYAQKVAKRDASGKLTVAGQSLRLSGGGSGVGEKFWYILAQYGGSIVKEVSPDKYKADYDNEAGFKALKLHVDMVHKYKTDDVTLKHDAEAFETEKAAFFQRESWVIGEIKTKAPNLDYDTAPFPKANVVQSRNFYVTNAAKGPKADVAWDFIRFMMKDENHKQMIVMSGWLPGRDDLKLDDVYAQSPQFKGYFTNVKQDLQTYPNLPEFDEILTKFADRLSNKGYTDATFVDNPDKMKAFLAEAAKESNEILKKAGHLAE